MKKTISLLLAALMLAALLSACGSQSAPTTATEAPTLAPETQAPETQPARTSALPYQFTDSLGNTVSVGSIDHVAAIGGSNAETWLLAGGSLAALTEDAYSERGIEPSEEVTNLGAMSSPDVETMIQLGIDFAILNAKVADHVALRDTLESAGITTAYFEIETFDDYLNMLKICTDLTGCPELYEENGTSVQAQIDAAIARSEGQEAPTVLFIRAYSTGAKAKGSDSMTGAMLKDMGCINIADSDESLLDSLSMEAIIQADPDFILVTIQGSSIEAGEETMAEMFESNPAWSGLTAVRNGRYVMLPRNLFHYKPNARWGESYEMLADILYGAA